MTTKTATKKVMCPFNKKMVCIDCTLYRGRHRSCGSKFVDSVSDLKALENLLNPSLSAEELDRRINIRVIYINVEDVTSREVDYTELKDLDYDNPFFVRKVDGLHINSYEKLLKILKMKEEDGREMVEFVEAPVFMLHGGC